MTFDDFMWHSPFHRYTIRQLLRFFDGRTRLEVDDIPNLKTQTRVKRYLLLNWPTANFGTATAFACYCVRQALSEFHRTHPTNPLLTQALYAVTSETVDTESLHTYLEQVRDRIVQLTLTGATDEVCVARAVERTIALSLGFGAVTASATAQYVSTLALWVLRKRSRRFRCDAATAQLKMLVYLLTSEGRNS